MSLYTTSTHELMRKGNARAMTGLSSSMNEKNVKAAGRNLSRSEEFHQAATAHRSNAWDSVHEQLISRNVGRKAENVTPKTPRRISDN